MAIFHTNDNEELLHTKRDMGTDEIIAYITSEHNFLTFSESMRRLILRNDHTLDESDLKSDSDIIQIICDTFKNAGIKFLRDTVSDWIKKETRPTGKGDYALKICFAFDIFKGKPEWADSFMQKDCYLDGFSPRNPMDIIAWYSIAKGYSYAKYEELLQTYSERIIGITPLDDESPNVEYTKVLVSKFFSSALKNSDEELINEIVDYYEAGKFGKYRKTAYDFFIKDRNDLIANSELSDDQVDKYSARALAKTLFPRPLQKPVRDKIEKTSKQKKSKVVEPLRYSYSKFSKDISKGLPQKGDILKFEKGTADVTRKALILLYFAVHSIHVWDEENYEKTQRQHFDSFRTEMNMRLSQCGMYELYQGNPFDMLMMLCAYNEEPNDYFADVIKVAYGLSVTV